MLQVVLAFLISFAQISKAQEKPAKLAASHDELKMLIETEEHYTSFRGNTYLSEDGKYLVESDKKRIDFTKALRITHDLEQGTKEFKRLYKLRGKKACFEIYQAKDDIILSSFNEELCK